MKSVIVKNGTELYSPVFFMPHGSHGGEKHHMIVLRSPAIAELYEKDFWTLWSRVGDAVKREVFAKNDDEEEILKISTEDFVHVSTDDLV